MKTTRTVATLAATLITFGSLTGGANAAITVYSDLSSWQAAFSSGFVEFETSSANMALANEVGGAPGNNVDIGSTLTFDDSNTSLGFEFTVFDPNSGGFTFNDDEGGAGDAVWESGTLSPGDINNGENDDFEVSANTPLYGFYLDFIDYEVGAGESFTLFNGVSTVATITAPSDLPTDQPNVRQFWGVVSTDPFDRVVYDENSDGDDIGIADFGFATSAPIPEPSSALLLGVGALGIVALRRRSC